MNIILLSLLTLLLGFILLLVIYIVQSGGLKSVSTNQSPYHKPSFLIIGANNAGKTSLYYKLQGEFDIKTISSIEPNFSTVKLPISTPAIGKSYQLVDYPGHAKYLNLFEKLLTKDITLGNVKGIIYMIDSSNSNWSNLANVESITKYLYRLLSITERRQNGVDVLFAVNKSDLFDSLPSHKIKSILEGEIEKLIKNELVNVNKSSEIDKISEDDEEIDNSDNLREFWLSVIGNPQGKFTFDKLEGNMDFISGSVLKNKFSPWENWLDENVVNS